MKEKVEFFCVMSQHVICILLAASVFLFKIAALCVYQKGVEDFVVSE